jgi:hypothetical protein
MRQKLDAGLHALREALHELSAAQDVPDARLLDEVVRRYPQLGGELTEFAVALALDALRERRALATEPASDPDAVSPAVNRAVRHFKDRLLQAGRAGPPPQARNSPDARVAEPPNPFQALDRSEFRALAERLNANAVFVCKLRDRQIDPDTIPLAFQRRVAQELDMPLEAVQAHFAARQAIQAGQFFKADGKPVVGARQSFEEAVRSSALTETQQKALLEI